MLAPIACVKRSFGRLSGSQPSAWFWAWSWDPLKFMRRHPPHHLSPARANHPAGQDPEARLSRPSHHSNAPISPESQSILSKIVALTPGKGSLFGNPLARRLHFACLIAFGWWKLPDVQEES